MSKKQGVMPTREQLRVWRDYVETSEALRARLTARLQADSELSSGDYQVLLALSEADDHSLRSSELAAHIGWERSRLSHHLGRMEKRGLITRAPCADAAHGVDVNLTDAARRLFAAVPCRTCAPSANSSSKPSLPNSSSGWTY